MSSGRGRSWRPQKKVNAKDSRRRTIFVLIGLLVALVGFLVITVFLQEPPVGFVNLTPADYELDGTGLSELPHSATTVSQATLLQLFQKLHELNDARVLQPEPAESLEELISVAKSGSRLVLYCGWPLIVRYDDEADKAVAAFRPGGKAEDIDAAELLNALQELKADQITLLLDAVPPVRGLASGKLSDDALRLLKAEVEAADVPRLIVICACDSGQRSWEYIADAKSSADAASSTEDEQAGADESTASGKFAGTAFAHFARQAFIDGYTSTRQELFDELKKDVEKWVDDAYGETQTVTMLPSDAKSASLRLLDMDGRVTEKDLAESDEATEPAAEDLANDKAGDGAGDEAAGKQQIAAETKDDSDEAHLQEKIAIRDRLAASGEAAAAMPQQWMELNASLSAAEYALLNGDEVLFRKLHGRISGYLDELQHASNATQGGSFHPWLTALPGKTETSTTADDEPGFELRRLLRDVGAEENPKELPSSLQKKGDARDSFVHAFVDDLKGLLKIDPKQRPAAMADRARFMKQLPAAGWPRNEWPQEFFTIDEVLTEANAGSLGDVLQPLVSLIETRRNTLDVASGQFPNGNLIQRRVWEQADVQQKIREVLTMLTASERWLALGPTGLDMAKRTLSDAVSASVSLQNLLDTRQRLVSLRDQQRTELPMLIQFVAQQQEEVPFVSGMFDSAIQMADAEIESRADARSAFPDGLLKQTELESRDVDALFALTRNFSAGDPAGPQDADQQHLRQIREYVQRRIHFAPTATERFRLLPLPGFTVDRPELIKSLTTLGDETQIGDNNRTGLWVSFWSIRLLEAFTEEKQTDLWRQWKRLAELLQQQNKEPSNEQLPILFAARVQLASALRSEWVRQHEKIATEKPHEIFVSVEQATQLIAGDLAQRHAASAANRSDYAILCMDLCGQSLSPQSVELIVPSDAAHLKDGRAAVSVQTQGATWLYVSKANVTLLNNSDNVQNWRKLADADTVRELTFASGGGVTEDMEILLAIANQDDIVVSARKITLYPDPTTSWQVRFFTKQDPLNPLTLVNNELKLPPSTRNDKGEDKPVPLTVQFEQTTGKAKSVRVQCVDSKGNPFWPEPLAVEIGANGRSANVPLPAAEAAPEAKPLTFDVLEGMTFQITADLVGAKTEEVQVRPVLASASEYVEVESPKYEANRLTFRVTPKSGVGSIRPEKLPVRVHFSPKLQSLLLEAGSTSLATLGEDGHAFSFSFVDAIQQAYDSGDLEFGLSVAGIPHAFRWRLNSTGVDKLHEVDDPIVRTEVELELPKAFPKVPSQDNAILVGENWQQAKLNVGLHIHGGQINGGAAEWQLGLRVENIDTRLSASVMEQTALRRRYNETIVASPGEGGAWNFATHTALHRHDGYNITENGFNDGRYRLIGQLRRIGSNEPPKEHGVPFTFDASPPTLPVQNIRVSNLSAAGWPVNQPLTLTITATDPQSGITKIEAGMVEGELREVRIRPGLQASGEIVIQPSQGFPEVPESTVTETRDAKIFVKVTNGAMLAKEESIIVRFYRTAKEMAPPPAEPGIVEFKWASKKSYKVTLAGGAPGFLPIVKDGNENEAVKFEVAAGKYKLLWTTNTGSGGTKGVTVTAGKTTTVEE